MLDGTFLIRLLSAPRTARNVLDSTSLNRSLSAPRTAHLVVTLALLPLASACARPVLPPQPLRLGGDTMGTTWHATVVAPGDAGPGLHEQLLALVERILERVDEEMSNWRPSSELSRFNRHAETTPFPLSAETLEVLELAREVSVASGGAFDVTVGPLVEAWGFGASGRQAAVPAPGTLAALAASVGYDKLVLDPAAGAATKLHPDLEIDLSAIAPGYAVDLIAAAFEQRGVTSYLVEIGGELRVSGRNPEGGRWRIAIERPQVTRATQRVIELGEGAVATSGDYRDFYEIDGVRYSHTLDPETGAPVAHSLASVTVVDPSCARADAWATALMVLGPERGMALADQRQMPVLFLIHDGESVRELESRELDRRFGRGRREAEVEG